MSTEMVFRRIHGRIVAIKRKKKDGIAEVAAATTLSAGSAVYAAKQIRMANFAYSKSAHLRGASKLVMGKGKTYTKLLQDASIFKIAGRNLARKGFGVLALGTTAAAVLATHGAHKINNPKSEEGDAAQAAAISATVTGIGFALFGRKARIGSLVKMARKANVKRPVSELFGLWSSKGMKRTRETIRKFGKSQFKSDNLPKGTNVDMFGEYKKNIFGKIK